MTRRAWSVGIALALSVLGWACENTSAHPILAIQPNADVRGVLFLDLNGNAQLDANDQPMKQWSVRLLGTNGAVLNTATSDSLGFFEFARAPSGSLRVDVDRALLGDTLQVFGLTAGTLTTLVQGDTARVTIGFTYPKVSVAGVDSVPLGYRVYVEGVALNAIGATGTRDLHIRSGSRALRLTNVVRRTVSPGDSIRVLGRRASEVNQAILTGADIILLRPSVIDPTALELTTRNAATGQEGASKADLARIRSADLVRSRNELSDVVLTVNDGTGPVEILIRSFFGSDASFYNADSVRVREATGLLVPFLDESGALGWRVTPRSAADLRLELEPKTKSPASPGASGR